MNGRVLVVSTLLLVGCGSQSGAPANELPEGQTITVKSAEGIATGTLSADGGHFGQGRNAFLAEFEPATTTLTGASAFMPAMGHGAPQPTVTQLTTGYSVSNVIFSMPGLWNVTFDLGVGDKTDQLEFSVDVP